jgi:flavin-binding protein dodecin
MSKIYQIVELVGTSKDGIEQAIDNAVKEVYKDNNKLNWFEVKEIRGFIDDEDSKYYQVTVKIGYSAGD